MRSPGSRLVMRSIVAFLASFMALSVAAPFASAYVVVGAIKVEYDQLGGASFFGNPLSDEQNTSTGGKFQNFSKGSSIYWHATRTKGAARQIGGLIRDKWGTVNYENGWLGYPTTRETATRKPGRFNAFENGYIYWSSATGAHTITGEIYQTWSANDWENGSYGFPTSDEYSYQGGKRQDFQGGSIEYHPGGFPVDWEGDDGGTDTAPDCGTSAACGTDARGSDSMGPQQLSVLTPGPSSRRGARTLEPCSAQTSAPAQPTTTAPQATEPTPTSSAPPSTVFSSPAPATPSGRQPAATTTELPDQASSESTVPPAASSTPADTTTPTQTPSSTSPTPAPSSPAAPSNTSSQAPTTTSPSPGSGGTSWCRTTDPSARGAAAPRTARAFLDATDPMCLTRAEEKWWGNRQRACYQNTGAVFILKNAALEEVGRITGSEYMRVVTNWNNTGWTSFYAFDIKSVTGAAAGANLSAQGSCVVRQGTGTCGNSGASDSTTGVPNNLLLAQSEFTGNVTGGNVVWVQGLVDIQIESLPTPGQPALPYAGQVQMARTRCDAAAKMRNTQGCVIGEVRPVWDLRSTPNIDQYRKHVSLAQQSGLPGYANNAGDGTTLTRITSDTAIDTRRNITCGGVTGPRTGGRSCDEYPMASTQQGGGNGVGAGVARTFPQSLCGIRDSGITELGDPPANRGTGYSVCLIPASQNSRAGSLQSWFYTKSRVIDGDDFLVRAM